MPKNVQCAQNDVLLFICLIGLTITAAQKRPIRAVQNIIGLIAEGGGAAPPVEPCADCILECSSFIGNMSEDEIHKQDWPQTKKCPTKGEKCIVTIALMIGQTGNSIITLRGCESDMPTINCKQGNGTTLWRGGSMWYGCCGMDFCNRPPFSFAIGGMSGLSKLNRFAHSMGMNFEIRVGRNDSLVILLGNVSQTNPKMLDFDKPLLVVRDLGDLLAIVDLEPGNPNATRHFFLKDDFSGFTDMFDILEEYLKGKSNESFAESNKLDPFTQQIPRKKYLDWLNSLPALDDTPECSQCKQKCMKEKPREKWQECVMEQCESITKFAAVDTYMKCT